MKKHFNKNLIMSVEEEELLEKFNTCWICGKLIELDDKVRDHDHITGKFREEKTLPITFHNLRGYDSHLIFKELSKFNCKISVIPSGLEKYMSFCLNRNIY